MPQLQGARSSSRSLAVLLVLALVALLVLEVLGVIDLVPGFGRVHAMAAGAPAAWRG